MKTNNINEETVNIVANVAPNKNKANIEKEYPNLHEKKNEENGLQKDSNPCHIARRQILLFYPFFFKKKKSNGNTEVQI